MSTDDRVLIAGAGPVGLVTALLLAKAGIAVTVCERQAAPQQDLRASTFHPPTLDMLDGLGLTRRVIDNGLIAPDWQYRDRATGPVAVFDMSVLKDDTAHPYRVQCEQWKLIGFLLDDLKREANVELCFDRALVGLETDAQGVSATFESSSGARETRRGKVLVGADGARSATRKAVGIEFPGLTLPELFLVVSTPFRFEDTFPGLSPINYMSDPDEWLVLLRTRDFWRVLLPADPATPAETLLSDEYVEAALQKVAKRDQPYETVHRTLYPVHQRVAASYQAGRVFLAGDAAHINNPLGGMGMNGGIHDAFELARQLIARWPLEDADGMDLYSRRRRPVAVDEVDAATMRNRAILNERDPSARAARLDELKRTAEDPVKARAFLRKSSMITGLEKAAALQ